MEKKGPQRDDHSSVGNIPELDSYDIIESPLLEILKNVFSLLEPAKQEIEEARRASLSTSSQQHAHSQTLDVEKLRLALGRAEQEIHALKNPSCNYTDNKSENAEKHLQEKIKSFELRISDLQKENEKLKCIVTDEKNAYQDVIKRQEEVITGMRAKHSAVEKTFKEMHDTISRLSKEKERDVAALQKELLETKTRLSKLMGDKLSNKNPDIADLSDSNRPTKLAEKFSELYDNQWTDAFEVAERLFKDQKEEYRIKVLLQMLMNVNKFCQEEFSGQERELKGNLLRTSKPQTEIPAALLKDLKDYRKSTAEECIPELVEKYLRNETKTSVKKLANEAKEFTYGCVSVCWLMAHQDPQVALHSNVQRMEIVDGNFYKAYTQSGKKVDYIVWPALLLYKDGPVLAKGVVQYIKPDEKKTESTKDLSKNHVTNSTKTENEKTKKIQSQQGNKSPLTGNFMSQSVRQKMSSSLNDKTGDFSKTVVGSTVTAIDIKDIVAEFDEVGQKGDTTMETGGKSVSKQKQQQQQQEMHHNNQLRQVNPLVGQHGARQELIMYNNSFDGNSSNAQSSGAKFVEQTSVNQVKYPTVGGQREDQNIEMSQLDNGQLTNNRNAESFVLDNQKSSTTAQRYDFYPSTHTAAQNQHNTLQSLPASQTNMSGTQQQQQQQQQPTPPSFTKHTTVNSDSLTTSKEYEKQSLRQVVDKANAEFAARNQQQSQFHPQNAHAGSQQSTGGFQQLTQHHNDCYGIHNQTISQYPPHLTPTDFELTWYYYYTQHFGYNAKLTMDSEFYPGAYEKCIYYLAWHYGYKP